MAALGTHIDYFAILAAALINFILGWFWFGPVLGRTWVKLGGGELKPGPMNIVLGFISALIIAYVLDNSVTFAFGFLKQSAIVAGLEVGFVCWIGFIAPVTFGPVIYERKSFKLWLMNNAYWLVSLLIMGAVLAVWR
jgi:hypothetical protein